MRPLLLPLALAALPLLAASNAAAQAGPDGLALFAKHCAICHGADASGIVGLAPPLKGDHWGKLGADRRYLPTVLLHGLSGNIKVNGQSYIGSMPPFAGQLDDALLADVANALRTLQGGPETAPYSADDFKPLRGVVGSPPATRALRIKLLGG